jgi:type I restriction enzyme M protein
MAAPSTLKSVLAILKKDAGVHGDAEMLGQLAWMVFLKALDDRETEQEIIDERYRSPIPERFRWRGFATDAQRDGAALLAFIDDELFPALSALPESRDPTTTVIREVFQVARNAMKSPQLFLDAVGALNEIDTNHLAARRALQSEFETLLGEGRSSSGGGKHHAPPPLARLLVEMLDPELGERILDPTCRSGAFLIAAVERIRDRWVRLPEHEAALARSIFGATRTASYWLLGTTNLLLHGLVVPAQVRCTDVLARPLRSLNDRFDVLVGMLPFGGNAEAGIAEGFPLPLRTTDLGALHLQHAMHVLRAEGRGALVLPDGALSSDGIMTRVREKLLEECDVHTVLRLPAGVLAPHSNARTVVLFFRRGRPTRELWYYEHHHPEGLKAYSRKSPLKSEDFDRFRAFWSKREESDTAFRVSIDAVKARDFNLDIRNPQVGAAVSVEIAGPPSPPRLEATQGAAASLAAQRGALRVRGVRLRDFRGFARLDLELPAAGSTVLIGVNGAGKSTVLDAIAAVLSPLAFVASGGAARHAEIQISPDDIRVGEELGRDGITLDVEGALQHWELRANRAKDAVSTAPEINAYARVLTERLLADTSTNLPVLCFYSSTRGLGEESAGKRLTFTHRQQKAYDRAFRRGLGPFQDFLDWFREEEDVENEDRLRKDPTHRNPRLEVVRRAVQRLLGELGTASFSELRIERFGEDRPARRGARKQGVLIVEKDGTPLPIEQLSEGEKNTILLVSDLARRLSEANPGREDPLTGSGVVLIDEIDAHLHPRWQRGFLPALEATFPGCQFIVSTHSPQVLSRVHREHVFIFESFKRLEVTPFTYGRDSTSILSEAMDVPERPLDVTARIRAAAELIDAERFDEGKAALRDLAALLGEHDVEVVRLKTVLAFLDD